MKKDYLYIMIITLLIIGIFQFKYCYEERYVKIDKITHTVKKKAFKPFNIIKPDPEVIYKYIHVTEIDTFVQFDTVVTYVTDYLSEKQYKDSVLMDSGELIVIDEKIYKNEIKSRQVSLFYDQKTIYLNKKNRFSIGINAGYGIGKDFKPSPYIGFGFSYNIFNIK